MVDSINDNLITQFNDMLHVKAQQIRARLKPFVQMKPMVGELFAYDGLGLVEAREVNGRLTPATFDDIEHNRRRIKKRRFVVNLPIDASDVRSMLIDPKGPYAEACTRAMERQFDRVGIEASFADVQTGREFGTTVTFGNDGGLTVDATAGVTYEKLLELRQNWINNEVGTDIEESMILCITGDEENALMQEIELTSGDFSRHFVVDKGRMTEAVGMNLIAFGADVPVPILNVTGGVRDNVAFTPRGLCYGISQNMKIKVQERSDFIEVDQVQIIGEWGAVRTEGLLVQKFTSTV